jgi:multidrug efflux pump subunit AcrA (membrane-fusion protein)
MILRLFPWILAAFPLASLAQTPLAPVTVTEWKAVYGQISTQDQIPARARIGGTLLSLQVAAGDEVVAGQELATIVDDKIAFQLSAFDAQIKALSAQLANAEAELARGQALLDRGVITMQNLDTLRTAVDVLKNQKAATAAARAATAQQETEGSVLAPIAGRVLSVPVTRNAVIQPGEPVAILGGGGYFLRLAVP